MAKTEVFLYKDLDGSVPPNKPRIGAMQNASELCKYYSSKKRGVE